jgi:hypothetical protein
MKASLGFVYVVSDIDIDGFDKLKKGFIYGPNVLNSRDNIIDIGDLVYVEKDRLHNLSKGAYYKMDDPISILSGCEFECGMYEADYMLSDLLQRASLLHKCIRTQRK